MRVCSFESRRASEMAALIERHGGVPTVAPSMQEIPLEENGPALDFADQLLAGSVHGVVFLTGVGARALLDAVTSRYDRDEFLAALDQVTIAIRGPKPAAVLKNWGTHVDVRAPEPNTWRELLEALRSVDVSGRTIAVQEYGEANAELYAELSSRGANVLPVPIYRWELPEDTGPLLEAIRSTIAGEFDVLLFTSANQVRNVLSVADTAGLREEWLTAANETLVASIGPTCTETLTDLGLRVDVEASPPKMGPLVRLSLEAARAHSDHGS